MVEARLNSSSSLIFSVKLKSLKECSIDLCNAAVTLFVTELAEILGLCCLDNVGAIFLKFSGLQQNIKDLSTKTNKREKHINLKSWNYINEFLKQIFSNIKLIR